GSDGAGASERRRRGADAHGQRRQGSCEQGRDHDRQQAGRRRVGVLMNPRASATKFTFDTVFDAQVDAVSDAAKARQKKSLTQGEIDALRAEARAEGLRAGEIRAAEAVAAAANEAANALRTVLQQSSADIEIVRAEAAKLALVAARTLARSALDALPASEVETCCVNRCIRRSANRASCCAQARRWRQ